MKNLICILVIFLITQINFSDEKRCDVLIFNESCLDNSCETSVDGSKNDGGDISLWIKTGPTFQYLKFTMIKDRFFYAVEQEESIVIKKGGLLKDQWNKVDFTIIIKEILYWPDKYSLKAIVNNQDTYIMDTGAYVAITSVLMTRVYVSGEAEVSFSCLPKTSAETSITSYSDSDGALRISNSSDTSITSFEDSDEVLRTADSSEISIPSLNNHKETIKISDGESPVTAATKNVTFSPTLTSAEDKLAKAISIATSFKSTNDKAKISTTTANVPKLKNFNNDDVKLFWNAKPIIELHDVTLVLSLFAIIVALCVFLPTLFIYFTMRRWYKRKLKKLGGNDLSNIESIDPKNTSNHYEEVLPNGNKDKNDSFYEEQKVNLDKDIYRIPAKGMANSKTDEKKDDFCHEETIYEKLPRNLKP